VALLAAAAIVGGVLGLGGSKGKHTGTGSTGGTTSAVTLRATGDYDPQGTGGEHAASARYATDGNPTTAWDTEHYASAAFGGLKSGLGLVLDGGFTPDSATRQVGGTTTFTLNGTTARYYVVWLTQLPPGGYAQIQEVRAR
jgi:hypothetical protein